LRRKPRQICAAQDCTKELSLATKTGYCPKHRHLYWENNPEASKQRSQNQSEGLKRSYTPERRKKISDWATTFNAEREAKIKVGWRPDDWNDWEKWPADRKMVGLMLIENRLLTNTEIGQILDESRLPCPFGNGRDGNSWERALTSPGTGANWILKVRKDLGIRARRSAG
jgi:hypothetical protein